MAHNPLDTLEEEDIFPEQTFASPSLHGLEMLQSGSGSSRVMAPVSDNSESSGKIGNWILRIFLFKMIEPLIVAVRSEITLNSVADFCQHVGGAV